MFSGETIVANRLYARYDCQQVVIPKKKPVAPEKPIA